MPRGTMYDTGSTLAGFTCVTECTQTPPAALPKRAIYPVLSLSCCSPSQPSYSDGIHLYDMHAWLNAVTTPEFAVAGYINGQN